MYQVIIIEDDSMVADINCRYIENTPGFAVQAVFQNGAQALEYLKGHDVSLIILDYYTPVMNGMEFVDRLHGMGKAPDIIMVTSASDAQIVCQMVSRGILDYLVKPFEYHRFREALDKFRQSHERWHTHDGALRQEEIDEMLCSTAGKTAPSQILAKGLNDSTMNMIRRFLMENSSSMFTSEEIAERVHLSRITVRRYMSFMVETNEITSTIDYQTGGRPAIKYSFSKIK